MLEGGAPPTWIRIANCYGGAAVNHGLLREKSGRSIWPGCIFFGSRAVGTLAGATHEQICCFDYANSAEQARSEFFG